MTSCSTVLWPRRRAGTCLVLVLAAAVASPATAAHAALDDRLVVVAPSQNDLKMQTVQADGAEKRNITGSFYPLSVQWSPDAAELAVSGLEQADIGSTAPRVLKVFQQDGGTQRTFATDVAYGAEGALTWTNDSSHVAYISGTQTDTRMSLVRRDGSARTVVDTGIRDMEHLQWAPDGSLVAFTSGAPGRRYVVNPDGSGLREIADQSSGPLAWSPDADRVAFSRTELIRVARTDGTVERDLGRGFTPFWSPDAETIAAFRDGTIVLMDPAGGSERVLAPELPVDRVLTSLRGWSPDSRQVLVTLETSQGRAAAPYVLDVDSDTITEVVNDADDNQHGGDGLFAPLPTTPPRTRAIDQACSGAPVAGFEDTAGNRFQREIDCVAWYEIARGQTTTLYGPASSVTRAQMALFLVRFAEQADAALDASDAGFTDLGGLSQEARDAVNSVANLGVARGVSEATFAPAGAVTRGQMASFLSRLHTAVAGEDLGPRVHCFADVSASVHRAAAERLCGAGIASGPRHGAYDPSAPVTRAQMAGFLARLVDAGVAAGTIDRPASRRAAP